MAGTAPGRVARWLLPALIALPFAAAVAVDVVRVVRRPPAVDRPLLELSVLRFEPADPVFDLRPPHRGAGETWERPEHSLASGWGQVAAEGRWTAGASASLEVDLSQGGQRVLLVEARADRRARDPVLLATSLNGVDCGRSELGRRLGVCRFTLPADAARPGANQLELELVDARTGEEARGRTALIRRVALAGDGPASFDELVTPPPLTIDRERGTVLIQRAGRFVAPFSTPRSGSVLSGRLRFRNPGDEAWCRVIVARCYAAPDRFDVVSERTLRSARSHTVKIRQELRDREEPVALIVDVSPAAAAGGVLLEELTVGVGPKR
jgi:hypothetical protein